MNRKSKKNKPMVITMIKDEVHVDLILWPIMHVRLDLGTDVARYEIHPFRIAEPFTALSEICYQYHADLLARGVNGPSLKLLKELETSTGMGRMFPVHELQAAGWTVPDFRRLEAA